MNDKTDVKRRPGLALAMLLAAAFVLAFGLETNISAQVAATGPPKPEPSATPADKSAEETKVNVEGVQVAVDPQTGKLREPTPEERQALIQAMRRLLSTSTDGLTVVQHPDGSETVDLEGRFQNLSVAKINADGTVSKQCVTTVKEAAAFLGVDAKTVTDSPQTATIGAAAGADKASPPPAAKRATQTPVRKRSRQAPR